MSLLVSSIAPHCHHLSLHFHSLSKTSQPIYATTEQLVVDAFIKAANKAGIQDPKVVPYYCHGLNTLYCINDIVASTCSDDNDGDHRCRNDCDSTNKIDASLMYKRWGVALDQLPITMSEWRRLVQSSISVRRPLEPIPSSSLSASLSLPSYLLQSIPTPLKDPIPSAEGSMKPLYKAAGAIDDLEYLENLCCYHDGDDRKEASKFHLAGKFSNLSAVPFEINEANAKKRLQYYLNTANNSMASYQDSRMLAYGVDTSLKLSSFLSLGCITPKMIWYEVVKYVLSNNNSSGHSTMINDDDVGKYEWKEPEKKSTTPAEHATWILIHLAIRDYFIYDAIRLRINNDSDDDDGGGGTVLEHSSRQWDNDDGDAFLLFQRWAQGRTGFPFIDASMKELLYTGFTSNRCRQNMASFLSKSMVAVDWRQGAQLFECLLIDEDYSVNYGNWRYLAGEGGDPRDRVFKVVSQGERYDGEAVLVRSWLVENEVGKEEGDREKEDVVLMMNRPWEKEGRGYSYFGVDYPTQPIVEVESQIGRGKKKR